MHEKEGTQKSLLTCASQDLFPFKEYFADAPGTLFNAESFEEDMETARGCWRHLRTMFQELEECRAFELLKVCSPSPPGVGGMPPPLSRSHHAAAGDMAASLEANSLVGNLWLLPKPTLPVTAPGASVR
jgi:hypothetical protein